MKSTMIAVNLALAFICLFEAGMMISAKTSGWGLLIGMALVLIATTNQLRKARF
jgi:hypothetical protein